MRFPGVSLKCMCWSSIKYGKGEKGSVQKSASIVLETSLLCQSAYKGESGKNLTDLSVRNLRMVLM